MECGGKLFEFVWSIKHIILIRQVFAGLYLRNILSLEKGLQVSYGVFNIKKNIALYEEDL